MEHYKGIVKLCKQIQKDASKSCHSKFASEFTQISDLFDESKDPASKDAVKHIEEGLEMVKELVEKHGRKGWFGKLIKKKKKKTKIDQHLADLIVDFQKALILVQLLVSIEQSSTPTKSDEKKKIVLWVDDNPENNKGEIKSAVDKYSLDIVQKISTKEAKDFLLDSKNISLKNSHPSDFRIITDCFRVDEGDDAGKNLIQWLRTSEEGSGYERTPILIYCSNLLNVLSLQNQYSNVLAANTSSQLDMFFNSMILASSVSSNVTNSNNIEKYSKWKRRRNFYF